MWEVRKQIVEIDNLDKDEGDKVNSLREKVVTSAKLAKTNVVSSYRKRKMPGAQEVSAAVDPSMNSTLGALAAPRTLKEGGIVTPSSTQQHPGGLVPGPSKRRCIVGVLSKLGTWNPKSSGPKNSNPQTSTPKSEFNCVLRDGSSVSSIESPEAPKHSGLTTDTSDESNLNEALDMLARNEPSGSEGSSDAILVIAADEHEATEALEKSGNSWVNKVVQPARVPSLVNLAMKSYCGKKIPSLQMLSKCVLLPSYKSMESSRNLLTGVMIKSLDASSKV